MLHPLGGEKVFLRRLNFFSSWKIVQLLSVRQLKILSENKWVFLGVIPSPSLFSLQTNPECDTACDTVKRFWYFYFACLQICRRRFALLSAWTWTMNFQKCDKLNILIWQTCFDFLISMLKRRLKMRNTFECIWVSKNFQNFIIFMFHKNRLDTYFHFFGFLHHILFYWSGVWFVSRRVL